MENPEHQTRVQKIDALNDSIQRHLKGIESMLETMVNATKKARMGAKDSVSIMVGQVAREAYELGKLVNAETTSKY